MVVDKKSLAGLVTMVKQPILLMSVYSTGNGGVSYILDASAGD